MTLISAQRMDALDDLFGRGELHRLVGMIESVHLEAKSIPYDLDTPFGRFELAKDVVAFANAEGGHLIIGVVTEREESSQIDRLSGLRLLSPQAIDTDQLLGILRGHVYPFPSDLTIQHHSAVSSGTDGVYVIRVPRQPRDRGPFLVLKVVQDGAPLREIVVGYVERIGDSNEPFTGKRLQQMFKSGSDSVAERLTRIEEKLDGISGGSVAEVVSPGRFDPDVARARILDILEESP